MRLLDGRREVGDVVFSDWRERAEIHIDGQRFQVARDGWWGPFELRGPAGQIATATKPSMWRRAAYVRLGPGSEVEVRRERAFGRAYEVRDAQAVRIGLIEPIGWLSSRIRIELPADWPLEVQAFVLTLVTVLMRRESRSFGSI